MADSSSETSKKSGFSFRKKRSNSKTRKEEPRPVDSETVNEPEIEKSGEISAGEAIESVSTKEQMGTTSDVEPISCGEESSPKADDQSPESQTTTKKKSKRRSRSLFKSRKNKSDKSVERNKEANNEGQHANEEQSRSCPTTDDNTTATKQVVVCEESDARAQSDVEYGGEASETDGEFAKDEEYEDDDETKASGNETGDETKKDGQKRKKKGFFKRGLSLRRSKSKKKRHNEPHDEKPDNPEEVEKVATILKPETVSFSTQTDVEDNGDEQDAIEPSTEQPDAEKGCAEQKKTPVKPVRKVSFIEPHYESSEGDSLTEEIVETGNDSQDATPEPTTDEPSREVATLVSEVPTKPEAVPEVDDDDDELTEVSSVASSLVASQQDSEEPHPLMETEETGSRITLVESGEIGEGSGTKPDEDENRPEIDPTECENLLEEETQPEKEASIEQDEKESRPEKNPSEGDQLLDEETAKKSDVDWMLQPSCDMSVELQRVRKQTMFSVKRLCCSVM